MGITIRKATADRVFRDIPVAYLIDGPNADKNAVRAVKRFWKANDSLRPSDIKFIVVELDIIKIAVVREYVSRHSLWAIDFSIFDFKQTDRLHLEEGSAEFVKLNWEDKLSWYKEQAKDYGFQIVKVEDPDRWYSNWTTANLKYEV